MHAYSCHPLLEAIFWIKAVKVQETLLKKSCLLLGIKRGKKYKNYEVLKLLRKLRN